MSNRELTVSDIGEIRLLKEVLLPHVAQGANILGDDCARLVLGDRSLLWSMDPCPTPVAQLLGVCSPDVRGWYTALINLSDIAACGGTPKGILVSLEMPDNTPVSFVENYQSGLMAALRKNDTPLLGGNVKSALRFSATGTIVGVEGARSVSRKIDADDCDAFLIGDCGSFWASVIGYAKGWGGITPSEQSFLRDALLYPSPQISAGKLLASLPFQVACMDCSDGPANAIFQLACVNSMDLIVPNEPEWCIPDAAFKVLDYHGISTENACYSFGDWQLACFVPHAEKDLFIEIFRGLSLTWMGRANRGRGSVCSSIGRQMSDESLNENFKNGYNSFENIDRLISRYLNSPIFN
jgi:thiamine monophosphate kinase